MSIPSARRDCELGTDYGEQVSCRRFGTATEEGREGVRMIAKS